MADLGLETRAALEALELGPRPLLVVDVDEVVLQFIGPLQVHLEGQGYRLDAISFAISGNVYRYGSRQPVPGQEVHGLIGSFFATEAHRQPPVDGAVAALERLGAQWDVVLLTNVPREQGEARAGRMRQLGVRHPVVVNDGPKGPALAHLAARVRQPIVFVDDGPSNLVSVRDAAPGVRLVHFVDDERFFRLAPDVPGTWLKTRDWVELEARLRDLPER